MTATTITLDSECALDPDVAGAKGAGLAALQAAGFPVPPAVILPVGVADRWPHGEAPGDLRRCLADACAHLGERLAVRTSATWEDGGSRAHAGVTATVLDVSGVDEVLDAVRTCLDESTSAAAAHGASGELAIIVQRLVAADWAGVAFTADPLTGDTDVVRLAAARGLGESLVQGTVAGDDIIVRGECIESGKTELDTAHIREIAHLARRIEERFGRPQDIEWALENGQLHIVQSRPITVLPIEPTYPEGNNWQKDAAHYPEPVTPFGWSVLEAVTEPIQEVFDEMGLLVRGLEEAYVGGQVYGRVLPAIGSSDSAAAPPPAWLLGVVSRVVPALRRRTRVATEAIESDRAGRWLDEWHTVQRSEMRTRNDEFRALDLTTLDDRALVTYVDGLLDHVRHGGRIHFRLFMALCHTLHALRQFVIEELGWDDNKTLSMLGGYSPASRVVNEELAAIRARLAAIPGALEAIATRHLDPVEVLATFDEGAAADLAAWADEHGWAMINYDAGLPVLAERPEVVRQLLLHDKSPDDTTVADVAVNEARDALDGERVARFDELLARARAVYPVREDNTIIVGDGPCSLMRRWMLEVSSRLVDRGVLEAREDGAHLMIEELRDAIGGAELDLRDRIARRRGEEAWARAHPGPAYIGEQADPPDISRLPRALRQVNEPILWVISHEYPTPVEHPTEDSVLLAGVGASAGTATGVVRVVRSHDELRTVRDGDVIVCQITSPAWAPIFSLASAIVADGGGVLSHAAIAAREHAIPAVLGTGTATTTLVDGQRVTVDGQRGLVLSAG